MFARRNRSTRLLKSILQKHGGKIQIHSEPGIGTTVTVALPVPSFVLRKGQSSASPETSRPTILVMEDNEAQQRLCEHMLIRMHCNVILTGTAEQGIREYVKAVENNSGIAISLCTDFFKSQHSFTQH